MRQVGSPLFAADAGIVEKKRIFKNLIPLLPSHAVVNLNGG
jgi:hypothetical protein